MERNNATDTKELLRQNMIEECRLLLLSFQLWNNRHWITLTDVRSFPKKLHHGEDQDSPKTDDGEAMK